MFDLFHQAQSREQESSQKLDLLRLSLEKCLNEKSQEPPQPPPAGGVGPSEGAPTSPQDSRPGRPLSTSPSVYYIRPASLTGINSDPFCFYVCGKLISPQD